jgi:tRNA nucleotidyltransferase/poly(A) polymerase
MKKEINITGKEQEHFQIALESIKIIEDNGFQCALIGGAVRDLLRRRFSNANVVINDLDFCVFDLNGNSIGHVEMQNLVDQINAIGFDIDPAGMKFLHFAAIKNGFEVEFGTPRAESYVDESRKPHCVPGNFKDDQLRRDFTINAIFAKIKLIGNKVELDIIAGENGVTDIINKVLKVINPTKMDKVLSDDPVRVLRAVRFAGYGFDPTFILNNKINTFPEEQFIKVSEERTFDELKKILRKGNVDLLFSSGLIQKIIPEFKEFDGKKFKKAELLHIVKVIKEADTDDMKLVALFHDLGKAFTGEFNIDKNKWQFIGHESISADLAKTILKRFNADNKTIDFVSGVCGKHMKVKFLGISRKSKLIKLLLTDKFLLPALKFNKFDWNGKPKQWQKDMQVEEQHQLISDKIMAVKELIDTKLTDEVTKKITKTVCDNENIKIHDRGKMILSAKINFLSKK